jgi:hypothetical protein
MLKNSELTINQGSNLKLKLGDKRSDKFFRLEFLRNRTVGKPLFIFKYSGINLNYRRISQIESQ